MSTEKQKIKYKIFIFLGIALLVYVVFMIWSSKRLTLSYSFIQDSANTRLVEFSGRALHAKELTINDRLVLIGRDETFTDTILLQKGYSVVTLRAEDGMGREVVKTVEFFNS
jgi:hypothetical protein